MDEFDEEPTVRRSAGGDREEELVSERGREGRLRVRWLATSGQQAVQAEMQLLAALEVAGVSAAPDVVVIEDEGYVRETAPPLARRSGRRAAEIGTPATGERLALARARADLDALVDALHERGWVLGAPSGRGIGVRADGSVVLVDLSGLRQEEGVAAQRKDRSWVDSVLQDEQRTLRRRVHRDGSTPFTNPLGLETADVAPPAPAQVASADAAVLPQPVAETTEQDDPTHPASFPLPTPRLVRAREAEHSSRGGGRGPRGIGTAVRDVLAEPRHRRTAALTATLVLVVAAVVAASTWGLSARDTEPAAGAGPVATAQETDAAPAPSIEDPWGLAAELAGARHAYVTGVSDQAVAIPGSEAFGADEQVRAAYEGVTVQGGGPVIHEAELVAAPTGDSSAVLNVVSSTAEHEVVEADGTVRSVPATAPVTIELALHWDGTSWRIQSVTETAAPERSATN